MRESGLDDEQVEAPTFLRGAVTHNGGGLVFEGGVRRGGTASAIASASRKSFFYPPRVGTHILGWHQPSVVAGAHNLWRGTHNLGNVYLKQT
jgi:hypothetical protein